MITDEESATIIEALSSFAGIVTDHPRGGAAGCVAVQVESESAIWQITVGLTGALIARGYTFAAAAELVSDLGPPDGFDHIGGGLVAYWRGLRAV